MNSGQKKMPAGQGAVVLVLVTALWGSSFVIIKRIIPDVPPSTINLVRFVVAALVLAPFVRRDRRLWRAGIELSLWLFAGYASQAIGLRYTTVNRSAFITAMNVIFVPLLAACLGRSIRPLIWAAAFTAFVGCGLLSYDGGNPNIGDLWTLMTAITWAAYIVRIETFAASFPSISLAAVQMVPVALFSAAWTAAADPHPIHHFHWPDLIYLGIAVTAATTWLQALSQRVVPAAQAALIFTLEPVFAAFFGYIILHERLGPRGMLGAALVILAAVASQLPRKNLPALTPSA